MSSVSDTKSMCFESTMNVLIICISAINIVT
jgi:hypothetical protein